MSRLFESHVSKPAAYAPRRPLLVKACPEKWSDLLQSVATEWDVTWVLNDEQFALELSQGKYSVAVFETKSLEIANRGDLTEGNPFGSESNDFGNQNSTPSSWTTGGQPTQFLSLRWHQDLGSEQPFRTIPKFVLTEIHQGTSRIDFQRWLQVAFDVSQLHAENATLQRRLANRRSPIIGNSPLIERLREQIAAFALHDWPVLIHGEPGTGRDLAARAIHEASDRAHRPFIKIDCRVHTSTSLGRELFGQATGMPNLPAETIPFRPLSESSHAEFSGMPGRFDLAEGGVLLIEGIDEIALPLQAVLAQVLERRTFQRVDEQHESPLNVRVIAVTSKDLFQLSEQGQFREDLLRHFVGPVLKTPALRDIRSDIAPLSEYLLQRISARLGIGPIRLFVDAVERLQAHRWPGNVGELESLLERVCLLNPGGKLTAKMIDDWLTGDPSVLDSRLPGMTLEQMERQYIEATFERCAGNRELTAHSLQIGIRTLSGKLRDYGYPPRGGPGSNRQLADRDAA